ncbi:PREDICTED: THAP domain-containing protein 10-like [Amphimedon queenslandica]|uniref:THAP-type domain-containing protein n=1 Tax=Amphimedon queenslandica TaxID=400682 RepID=A0AAN0JG05_AMPQE|nr:PREDICTED: THAP domain-containing protein 10-like [Amphimedon queenslandica]|eukprot:XP_019855970.1 PREDICTED: THAP domain-containing protein 10-like [Amphimedon queenslandica]
MPNHCVAFGCSNSSNKHSISTFHFPKDLALRKQWILNVKRTRDHWKGPTSSSVICSCHFTEDSFEESLKHYQSFSIKRKRKLKPNAIPTIFKRQCESDVEEPKSKRRNAVEKRKKHRV